MTPPNVVAADVSAPSGIVVVAEEAALVLKDGVAKGGYPVDVTTQSTVDLTSSSQSNLGCASPLIGSGLEPAAVEQFTDLDRQESYSREQDFPSSITEVIQPMEMAELVDILPTLSLIEEETPSGPSTSSVMDMLESFGLGIAENSTFFDLENSDLLNGAGCLSQPNLLCNSSSSDSTTVQEQDMPASHATVSGGGHDVPVSSWDKDSQVSSKGACLPVRNQVEWDRPSNCSS